MNKYGLIGSNVKYSYSKIIHEKLYKEFNINAKYDLISLNESELESYVNKLRDNEYSGFNITVPFKTEILKYVDEKSDSVKKLGACNTLLLKNGKIYADNTDTFGFKMLLNHFDIDLQKCFILGSGGSSKSVQYVLSNLKIEFDVISRNSTLNYKYLEKNITNESIINTTPIGMYPNIDESMISLDIASKATYIIDLIYNPNNTLLMSYNKNSYNGLVMLVYQAIKSFEIWTGIIIEEDLCKKIVKEIEVI
ncbi:MAG: shikimate dehydrogenase [bacterium]